MATHNHPSPGRQPPAVAQPGNPAKSAHHPAKMGAAPMPEKEAGKPDRQAPHPRHPH